MDRPIAPRANVTKNKPQDDPLNMHSDGSENNYSYIYV